MAFSRALGVIGMVSISWLAAVGCGDDDSSKQQPGAAGQGGEAGEGGTGTAGGPVAGSNNGGSGGSGGDGGNGNPEGGIGGDAGGTAGAGGQSVVGGAGGEAPLTPVAGAGGDGGAGGETSAAPRAKQCAYQCDNDEDCAGEAPGRCNLVTQRCENPDTACNTHADCIPFGNFSSPCESSPECLEGEACVILDGAGYCATLADSESNCADVEPLTVPNFDADGTSVVCVAQTARCNAGACIFGCADALFGGCGGEEGPGTGDTCNQETGLCECASSSECVAPGASVCLPDSHCGCSEASECTAVGQTVCVAGTCGCSAPTDCPSAVYPNATPVCE